MTLGDELRAVLSQEADMQYATPPDLDRLIIGGRRRRRQRNLARAGGTALALVLVGGGAYAVTHQDGGITQGSRLADAPSATSDSTGAPGSAVDLPPDAGPPGSLDPGTYRVVVGSDARGVVLQADMTLDAGWRAGNFPTTMLGVKYGGFGVYRPWSLGAGSGCESDPPSTDLGESPRALAKDLANLPRSTVLQPIEKTKAWGFDAQRLQLRIQEDCGFDALYRVAETPRGTRGINYGYGSTGVVIDFWVLDVDGATVVVDAWHQVGSSVKLVDKITRAAESITFVRP
jgi:hypothetical protein